MEMKPSAHEIQLPYTDAYIFAEHNWYKYISARCSFSQTINVDFFHYFTKRFMIAILNNIFLLILLRQNDLNLTNAFL